MILEGEKWENYSTPFIDKGGHTDKLQTFSLEDLRNHIESAIQTYKVNGIDSKDIPVFIRMNNQEYLVDTFSYGSSCKCSIQSCDLSKLILQSPNSNLKL